MKSPVSVGSTSHTARHKPNIARRLPVQVPEEYYRYKNKQGVCSQPDIDKAAGGQFVSLVTPSFTAVTPYSSLALKEAVRIRPVTVSWTIDEDDDFDKYYGKTMWRST